MSLLSRLFRFGKSETHALLDSLEDPVKMTEQGIRELKSQMTEAMKGLATVKAQAIRAAKDLETHKERAREYERKAVLLVERGQSGQMAEGEADRLASEALAKMQDAAALAAKAEQEVARFDELGANLDRQITTLRSKVSKYEGELRTLKARAQVSQATRKLNEQLAKVDSSGTIAMLEKMREKVDEEEALAEAYGEIAAIPTSVNDEINRALENSGQQEDHGLADLKARLAEQKTKLLSSPRA